MSVSTYSIIMAILWLNIFIFLNSILRRKTGVLLQYSLFPLLLLSLFGLFRILFPIEVPKAVLLESSIVYPWIQSIWNFQLSVYSTTFYCWARKLGRGNLYFSREFLPETDRRRQVCSLCRWAKNRCFIPRRHLNGTIQFSSDIGITILLALPVGFQSKN